MSHLLRSAGLIILSLGGLTSWAADRETPSPNILVIVSDNQGWQDIGYNNSKIATPTLDHLMTTGVRLNHFYVYSMCSPTRVGFISGRAPSRYGIHGAIGQRSRQALPPTTVTIADSLKAQGYETGIRGKWHLGLRPEVGPLQYGFDSSYGYLHGQIDKLTHLYKNGDRSWHRNDKFIDEEGHSLDLITADAIQFIKTKRNKPFFLYVPYGAPHPPLQDAAKWVKPYEKVFDSRSRQLYAASVSHMDYGISQLIRALEETDQRKNTLVVFFSDNGAVEEIPRQQKNYEGRFGPYPVLGNNGPLRGWIGDVYDGCLRTPALVNWPGVLKPKVVDQVTSVLDWHPTLAALAKGRIDPSLKLEGRNIWSAIADGEQLKPTTLYWRNSNGRRQAVRQNNWKLVFDSRTQMVELFDMQNDPQEKNNLAHTHPERVKQLQTVLAAQLALDP